MQESSAPSAEPTPAREPSWMPVPLPKAFKLPKANGRQRWFFGRRRDQYVGMAPDFLWAPSQPTGAVPEAPPAPPGFISTEATTPSTTLTEPLTEPESETSGEEPSEPAQPLSVNECQSDNTDDPTLANLAAVAAGEVSLDEFLTLVRAGIFTDEGIVGKVAQYQGRPLKERSELVQAISEIKGGPITGPIRTALRALDGLPPVPGD